MRRYLYLKVYIHRLWGKNWITIYSRDLGRQIWKNYSRRHITGNRKVLTRVVFDKIRAQQYLNPIRRHLWIMLQSLYINSSSIITKGDTVGDGLVIAVQRHSEGREEEGAKEEDKKADAR